MPGTSPYWSAAHEPKGLIGIKMKRDPALRSVQGQAPAKIHSPHLPDEASRHAGLLDQQAKGLKLWIPTMGTSRLRVALETDFNVV
jgi:hypothetical protein